MTTRVRRGCAADSAAIDNPSRNASVSVPRCGFRGGARSRRIARPAGRPRLSVVDDTQGRGGLVGAPRQFQDRLLVEGGRVVEAHVALGSSREDLAAVGGEIDRVEGMVERYALLEPVSFHIDARESCIHAVCMLPVGTQYGRENQRGKEFEVRI